MNIYSGFFLGDGSHITWEFNPSKCSLPEGVKDGEAVTVIVVGKYEDDEGFKADIVEVITNDGKTLTKQGNGTPLHITRRVPKGGSPVESGLRARDRGWVKVRGAVVGAIAGYFTNNFKE